ncbi:MAG: SEL1-like repeat protein [Gammaproteobacteria bacterium]
MSDESKTIEAESKTKHEDVLSDIMPTGLCCPISTKPMLDPVINTHTIEGKTYDRSSLIKDSKYVATHWIPNFTLKKAVDEFLEKYPQLKESNYISRVNRVLFERHAKLIYRSLKALDADKKLSPILDQFLELIDRPFKSTTSETTEELPAFTCPISFAPMQNPSMAITAAGAHSYEKKSIHQWIHGKVKPSDPLTNTPLKYITLIENHALKSAIEDYPRAVVALNKLTLLDEREKMTKALHELLEQITLLPNSKSKYESIFRKTEIYFEQQQPKLASESAHKLAEDKNPLAYAYLSHLYFNTDPDKGGQFIKLYSENFSQTEEDINKNQLDAYFGLGLFYQLMEDPLAKSQALLWFLIAAKQGHVLAQFHVAEYYMSGEVSGIQDAKKSIEWYQLAAENGHSIAQFNLGKYYDSGIGVVQSKAEAVKWFKRAAEQNNCVAQYWLSVTYYHGVGVDKDLKQAVQYTQAAAANGHRQAQCDLAQHYYQGEGIEKDLKKSFKWHKLAADQGLAKAQIQLSRYYGRGEGVAPDSVKSLKWLQKAVDQHDPIAQVELGYHYLNGSNGVSADLKLAVDYFGKAAAQGNSSGQNNLGWCHTLGWGIAQDHKKAVALFQKAAEQSSWAQIHLGYHYQYGLNGVSKNIPEALKYYQLAAQKNDRLSKYAEVFLGWCYEQGIGVAQDAKQAFSLYKRATEAGHPIAQQHLSRCYRLGIGTAVNTKEAEQQAVINHQSWESEAPFFALCCQYGLGTVADPEQVKSWSDLMPESRRGSIMTFKAESEELSRDAQKIQKRAIGFTSSSTSQSLSESSSVSSSTSVSSALNVSFFGASESPPVEAETVSKSNKSATASTTKK